MHWIYILSDDCNMKYYVGETERLYRRLWEHGRGECENTSIFECNQIVAIYKLNNMATFFEYNKKIIDINNDENLKYLYNTGHNNSKYVLNNWNDMTVDGKLCARETENFITECMMLGKNNQGKYIHKFKNIHGGKYIRFDCKYKFPDNYYTPYIKQLPLCHCGLPCDVKKIDNNNYLFFRCPKKNFWPKFREAFDIEDEPCSFFQKYTLDKNLKLQEKELKNLDWLKNVPSHKSLSPDKEFTAYCIAHDVLNEEKLRKEYGDDYEDWREEGGKYTECGYYKYRFMVKCNEGIRRAICHECCERYKDDLGKIFAKEKIKVNFKSLLLPT